jgi:HAD superfamily hydrolase (TIGR01549 family)
MANIKHVCLDKDGTLIDVHRSWVPITQRRTLKIRQFYRLGEDLHKLLALVMGVDLQRGRIIPGGPVGYKARPFIMETVAQWLNNKNIPATIDQLTTIFAEVDHDIQESKDFNAAAMPGVVEGIKRLKSAGFKISVYTSDRNKSTSLVLEMIGLKECVDAIVGGDDVQKPKPDPEGFLKACQAVHVPAERSIYVGDSMDDMRTAKGRTYGVAYGIAGKEELVSSGAQKVFDTFNDLTEFLLHHD